MIRSTNLAMPPLEASMLKKSLQDLMRHNHIKVIWAWLYVPGTILECREDGKWVVPEDVNQNPISRPELDWRIKHDKI